MPRRAALTAARVAAKLTQADLARRAGMDRSYLSHLEAGDCDPSAGVALRLSEVLGVHPRDLFPELVAISVPDASTAIVSPIRRPATHHGPQGGRANEA